MRGRLDATDIVVLNLDRSADRLRQFVQHNPVHDDIRRASAVDGRLVDRSKLIAEGVLAADLAYSDGALGNALSHIVQWQQAVACGRSRTVLEDDAVLCRNFRDEAARLIAMLPPGWDFVQWGYNFDTFLTFDVLPGLSTCTATFNQDSLRRGIAGFHATSVSSATYRLVSALGTVGYTVSPGGAARLLGACRPLRQTVSYYPGLAVWFGNRSLDYMLNSLHATMSTHVAVPALVVTANEAAISTVQPPADGQGLR